MSTKIIVEIDYKNPDQNALLRPTLTAKLIYYPKGDKYTFDNGRGDITYFDKNDLELFIECLDKLAKSNGNKSKKSLEELEKIAFSEDDDIRI